jgi:hypothetical protein
VWFDNPFDVDTTEADVTTEAPTTAAPIVVPTAPPTTAAPPRPPTIAPTVPSPTKAPTTTAAPAPANCPNGTYVNSNGVTVCSPYQSPSGPPAGATATGNDGTYSFSQHRSGTCSGHGGVASWL